MYIPAQFKIEDLQELEGVLAAAPLASFVTLGSQGLISTPLPLLLDISEGDYGVLYGHIAKANPQWRDSKACEALAIFLGPDAYISPAWYATKRETDKVVPTWNYVAVHAYGVPEFIEDKARLLDIVTKLTSQHEAGQNAPWAVSDAPDGFIQRQLGAIVGIRMPISRLEGKRKMSQNRTADDRAGVAEGLLQSPRAIDREISSLIPQG